MISTMDSRIATLEQEMMELGQMVETAISRAVTALVRHDTFLARAIIDEDFDIDRAEVKIQELCLEVLEKERPAGADLRLIVAALKINDGLERIADLAENIAQVVVEVGNWERFLQVGGIDQLADEAQKMVHQSLKAFVDRDPALARKVLESDDIPDAMRDRINERIQMEMDRIPENASPLMKLAHVANQFERMADLACNISEEVIYVVDGHIVRHDGRFLGS